MSGRLAVLAAVLGNATLRRLELAFLLFSVGEWATWVAVIVYAYDRGGAPEAGIVAFVELAPAFFLAPTIAGLGDRYPRIRVLVGTYASQALLMAATAVALAANGPPILIYLLATVTATAVSWSRPLQASLLPEVITKPDDLTAANVVSGMAESAGSLLGPLAAGALIAIGGPTLVFVATAIGIAAAGILLAGLARAAGRAAAVDAGSAALGIAAIEVVRLGWLEELRAGFAAIRSDHRLRAVLAIAAWATFLVGALDILYAVLAIDLLDLGGSAVGYLGALGGVGATLGSAGALLLVGRERLGLALGGSAAVFGLSIAAIGLAPATVPAALLLTTAGVGAGLTAVAAQTLIQRLAGDDVMSRVFGVLQGLAMGSTALGALAVPIVIALVGERLAFVVVGVSLPVAFLLLGRAIRASDRLAPERLDELRLLRAVPMLGPLSAPVLERLSADAVRIQRFAGAAIIRIGERGDRFYVVDEGELEVEVDGREVRRLGPGDGFGEIALVRDVPRTATITAATDVVLLAIDREPFLAALTGQARSRTIAAGIAEHHLT
ncbi:MAG TPA: MFS transporter, partial [Candidatus Limnocylindrales bacterium]|nr:MFS transporter [Candidatus Limnocylindrales bacterium]